MSFSPLPATLLAALAEGETAERFLIEGRHAVRAALAAGWAVEAVVVVATGGEACDGITEAALARGVPIHSLARDATAASLGFSFHRGVLAIARKPAAAFADWLRAAGTRARRVVILESLADPGNVGTVIRNAAAFGFDAVICAAGGASPHNAKAVRASATAIFHLPVFSAASVASVSAMCPGWCFIGTDVSPGATTLPDFLHDPPSGPLAVVLGGEASGLSPEALASCRRRITIPITSRVESLNVASASAILLHALGAGTQEG